MKEAEFNTIMKKYMKNTNSAADIDHSVMNRIKKYEEKRSVRMLYLEYVLSAVIFVSGIISIIFIQDILCFFIPYSEFDLYLTVTRWISTGAFIFIILSSFFIVYFTSVLKIKKLGGLN